MSLRKAVIILAILIGGFVGAGAYTFIYAEGFSYFSTDPKACVNCHIMTPQYESWMKSSHHANATCVDCHIPEGFVAKYMAKAENGYHHSKAFTFQDFHEPIMIKEKNKKILQKSCLKCHDDMVHEMVGSNRDDQGGVSCLHCHATVGHGALPTSIGNRDLGEKKELEK